MRRVEVRIVEQARAHLDGQRDAAGGVARRAHLARFVQPAGDLHGFGLAQQVGGIEGGGGHLGIRAVDEHLHLGLLGVGQAFGIVRRDAQPDLGAAGGKRPLKGFLIGRVLDDIEAAGIGKFRHKLAPLGAPVEVEDHHRDVLDLGIQGVAEDQGLEQRHQQHEKKRGGLAAQMGEFLRQNRA